MPDVVAVCDTGTREAFGYTYPLKSFSRPGSTSTGLHRPTAYGRALGAAW